MELQLPCISIAKPAVWVVEMENDFESKESSVVEWEREKERLGRINSVYLLIISRYKDYIEEKEELSVAELPILVMPKSPLVYAKAEEIMSAMPNFSYESNFYEASIEAFNFVRNEIEDVALPLQFWLTPEELLSFKVGDITDKNILLCSLFIALGNPSAKVVVMISDSERRIKTYYEFKGRITLFDIANGETRTFETKDEMLNLFDIKEDTTAYEFNDQMYVDIS
jgi:hypothetical protein